MVNSSQCSILLEKNAKQKKTSIPTKKKTKKLNFKTFFIFTMMGSLGLFMESASTLKDALVTVSKL